MKGFIDLVFRFEDRFYLLDWKSNHLGSRPEDYRRDLLPSVMESESYILQYYIYLAALDEYLEKRVPGYDYESGMGGVFYIFLRGVHPERGPDYGIYYDLPGKNEISWFKNRLLYGVGHES